MGKRRHAAVEDAEQEAAESSRLLKVVKRNLAAVETSLSDLQACISGSAQPSQQQQLPAGLSQQTRQLLQLCLDNDLHEQLGQLLQTWDNDTLLAVIKDWSADTFASICALWPPAFTANLLAAKPAKWVARACESMQVTELCHLLPLLSLKKARRVLDKLYFKAGDPYLNERQCARVLRSFPAEVCLKLAAELGPAAQHVLSNTRPGQPDLEDEDDMYDSSFIDDDDDEEGGDDNGHGSGEVGGSGQASEGSGESGGSAGSGDPEESEEEEAAAPRRKKRVRRGVVESDSGGSDSGDSDYTPSEE